MSYFGRPRELQFLNDVFLVFPTLRSARISYLGWALGVDRLTVSYIITVDSFPM